MEELYNNFVTPKIALALKDLGFNEDVFRYFMFPDPKTPKEEQQIVAIVEYGEDCENETYFVKAPLWQQSIDFLRNKYNIHVCVDFENWSDYSKTFEYTSYLLYQSDFLTFKEKTEEYSEKVKCIVRRQDNPHLYFESYESAREAAILKAIEIIKNK